MGKLLYCLITIIFISSCVEISFKEPQPQGIPDEISFPEKIQGLYVADSNNTIIITNKNIKYLTSNNVEVDEDLSDSVKLRVYKNYHFVNVKEDNYWGLYVLKLKKNKLDVLFASNDTSTTIEKIKKITDVEEIFDQSGKTDRYVLDPTSKELMKILRKNIFTKVGTFEKNQ